MRTTGPINATNHANEKALNPPNPYNLTFLICHRAQEQYSSGYTRYIHTWIQAIISNP